MVMLYNITRYKGHIHVIGTSTNPEFSSKIVSEFIYIKNSTEKDQSRKKFHQIT